ncbi:MAG: GAF domain-containing protein [Anaerolineaceae bacterium]|nr:GAF domain-containing protein [Anaerolineaceae bacterium]
MTPISQGSDRAPVLVNRTRDRYLYVLIVFITFASMLGAVSISISSEPNQFLLGFTISLFVMSVIALIVLWRGHITLAIYIVILQSVVGVFATSQIDIWWMLFDAILAAITASVLAERNFYRIVMTLVLGTILALIIHSIQIDKIGNGQLVPYLVIMLCVTIVGVTTRYFTIQSRKAAEVAASSANLLQAAAATSEIIGKLLKLDELLSQAIELIRERFAFYHVQIFLLDEAGENAQLAASTGSVGQMLFERHHSLPVGSRSVIGRVTSSGQPVTANDTDPFYHRNELLPNTRSELALPILDGDKIIGALDVQSRRYEVFTTEVIQALQVVANQLGITIRNARLFEEQEKTTNDARRLFLESETNLREIQRLNQQLTRSGWQDYLQTGKPVSGVTLNGTAITPAAEWTDSLRAATRARQAVTTEREGQKIISVPMVLDNEVIGAIEVEATGTTQESDITEMVNAVAQRLALSLDKARLFEESQEATAREQRINEIVTRYQSVNNIDELLRITLLELSQSLGATHSSIRLGTAPVVSLNGEGHA